MSKNVSYNDEIIGEAKDVAPSFEFSLFAQAAVREKIQRERLLRQKLLEASS